GVAEVSAGLRQAQHLRARSLGLQQEGGEIRRSERYPYRTDVLAAVRLDHLGGRVLQLRAEGIIRRQIEPALAAGVDDGGCGAVGEGGRIVDIVDRVGRAVLVGQGRAARADDEQWHFLHRRNFRHGDIDPGVGPAQQQVEASLVGPLAELRRPDVGLVLVVGAQRHDLLAEYRAAEVRDRHVDGLNPARAEYVRVHAG